jgi:hypothetical protein
MLRLFSLPRPERWLGRSLALFVSSALFLSSTNGWADEQQGKVTHDLTVGAAHDVQLKAGQTVQVLKQSGGTAVIMVQLPDGSSGIYQIDGADLELTVPSSAPPASSPAPAVSATPAAQPSAPASPQVPSVAPVSAAPPVPAPAVIPPAPAPAPVAGDPERPEDKVNLLHVSLARDTQLPSPYENLDVAKAGSYSYRLYLPPGYYEHPDLHYPALFIMAPGGHATLDQIQARAHDEGWIVIAFMEARNGPWGPIYGDMLATYPDVVPRLRIQAGLQFATGFSGGGRGTSMLTQICPGFDGELLQGAGFFAASGGTYEMEGIPRDHPYAVFMAVGSKDKNFSEIDAMKQQLPRLPFRSVTFMGGHKEAPQEIFDEGLDWLVEQCLLAADPLPDDLRACGVRQFGFMAGRWAAETDSAEKTTDAKSLAALGDKLDFASGSPEALALDKIKSSLQAAP